MKKLLALFLACLAMQAPIYSNNVTWDSAPTTLSGSSINASDAQIDIDANGNAVAAWIENSLVKSSSKPVSGSWSSTSTLSIATASSVRLVSDSNGNATAIWVENGVIKAATKTLSGSWTSSVALSSTGASQPTLCVDGAGNAVAAWVRSGDVETSTKLFGMSWSTKVTINSTGAANPVVAVGGTGSGTRAVVVWQGTSGTNNVVYAATRLIPGTWSSAVAISESTHQAVKPFVAVDANANAQAIWYAYDLIGSRYTNVVVKTSTRSGVTGTWNSVTSLSSPGIRNPETLNAQIAFDSIGNAIALWNTSFDDETYTLQSAVNPVNGEWSETIDLVNSNLYANAGDLAVTSFGDVLGLYLFYNGNALQIQSIESDINGYLNNFWSVPITISNGADNGFPKVAASINGNVIKAAAIWLHYNGAYNSAVASTGSKTLVLPPSNLQVAQSTNNFGVFSEYYNTLTWTASTDTNVVGYLVFRNGDFLAKVEADVLQYVDNNRVVNGAVTYSVTAIDSQDTQSRTVSVNFP